MVSQTEDVVDELDELANQPFESDEASAPYVGKWNRLVSRTNWEKGRIICQWRESLIEADRPSHEYSDEAWAARVGGISAQHVGRLRRVWQRFGSSFEQYDGLYWSHFLIAMDWEDAEMWLEGAAQSGWSVSQMRGQRWEALGAPDELKPQDEDVLTSEWDEDSPLRPAGDTLRVTTPGEEVFEEDGAGDGPDQRNDASPSSSTEGSKSLQDSDTAGQAAGSRTEGPAVRPFAGLPELPDDVAEAFEQFKIAILAHRMTGWQETSCEHVVRALDALKALALAPVESDAL